MSKLKYFSFLLILLLFISCKDNSDHINEEIKISVTLPPFADLTKQIVGDRAIVNTLIPPGTNAHSYDPAPQQLKKVLDADIYFRVGSLFKLENILLDKIKENISNIVDCSKGVEFIEKDPHYWLSPVNAKIITQNILETLNETYPQHKNYFTNNRNQFVRKIDSLDAAIKNNLSGKVERILFVYHPAWKYFAKNYGLEEIAIEQDGKHPKAKNLKNFIEIAKAKGVSCIFFDPHFDDSAVTTIASSLGLKIDSLDPLPENYIQNLIDIDNKLNIYLK